MTGPGAAQASRPIGAQRVPSGAGSHGLVARWRELADLDSAVLHARRSLPSAVLLQGEPGTGKTALIETTVTRAIDFRTIVLSGDDVPASPHAPSSWPLSLIDLLGEASLWDEGAGASGQWAARTNGIDLAREAILTITAKSQLPLLVTIDNAQELPASFIVALLDAVLNEMPNEPVALVVAERTLPHDPPRELSVKGVSRHDLNGLTRSQVRELYELHHLPMPAPQVLDALHHGTGGNPAALLDLHARIGMDALEAWRSLPEPLPVSGAVVGPFGRCLCRFEENVRTVLAAVATAPLPLILLDRVLARLSLSRELLEAPAQSGIVVVRSRRVQFAHPLVRVAAHQLVSADLRGSLHHAVSEVYREEGAVELSAFHDAQASSRRSNRLARIYGEAARAALDRSDARAVAAHREAAAEFSESEDAEAQMLARAAAGWLSAAEPARALVCLDRAERLEMGPLAKAEVCYQRVRVEMSGSTDPLLSETLLEAAASIEKDDPSRALVMIADAACCAALGGAPDAAFEIVEGAQELASVVGSQSGAVVAALRSALALRCGRDSDGAALIAGSDFLIGQSYRLPASPHCALLIGSALLDLDLRQTMKWASWIERCATATGDGALGCVPLVLQAAAALRHGQLKDAEASASAALAAADSSLQPVIAAHALIVLMEALAAKGCYATAYEHASRLLGELSERDGRLRARVYIALASLDLQRERIRSALAWLRAAESEQGAEHTGATQRLLEEDSLPTLAAVMTLAGKRNELSALVGRLTAPSAGSHSTLNGRTGPHLAYLQGLAIADVRDAAACFRMALASSSASPLLGAHIELAWGLRAGEGNALTEAVRHLDLAATRFEKVGASGWAKLAESERERFRLRVEAIPNGSVTRLAEKHIRHLNQIDDGEAAFAGPATWEITLLGSFAVRRNGVDLAALPGMTAQGLKVVALNERILAEELAELLWPDSGAGVGVRRLRNVLWRIRANCGDLLLRAENFVLLAPEAVTDVARMRVLARRALDPATAPERATELAREALRYYAGELLPGDRYVDWPTSARESLSRLYVQLLELLLRIAVDSGQHAEALSLLDNLTEADPYEERHYVRAGELHMLLGSPSRAMGMVTRAERMLHDLGILPSSALRALRGELTSR